MTFSSCFVSIRCETGFVSDLGQMCPKLRTPQQWRSLWDRRCSRNATPSHRSPPSGGRWRRWRRQSRPSRSSSLWEERRQTEASRRQWGSAWHSRNRRAASPHRTRHRHHLETRRRKHWFLFKAWLDLSPRTSHFYFCVVSEFVPELTVMASTNCSLQLFVPISTARLVFLMSLSTVLWNTAGHRKPAVNHQQVQMKLNHMYVPDDHFPIHPISKVL